MPQSQVLLTWSRIFASAFLLLPARASAAADGWRRPRTCLTGVAPYAEGQRKNISVNGVSGPLKIGHGDWEAGQLLGWISRILIEEVLGINVELVAHPLSASGLAAVSGCKNTLAFFTMEDAKCDTSEPPLSHFLLPIWKNAEADLVEAWISRNRPAQYPINLGSIGYTGHDGFFIRDSPARPRLLEYCMSFSDPRIDASSYFDAMGDVSTSDLRPCSNTILASADHARSFAAATQDIAGVTAQGDAFTCTNNHWWVAPACRANMSQCIPAISGGYGWELDTLAQRAVKWEMPLALATAKDWATYLTLPKTKRVVTYWWYPETAFLQQNPTWLVFPPHSPAQWAAGIRFSSYPPTYIGKWGFAGLENRSNTGTGRPLQFMRNMKVTTQQIMDIMESYITKTRGDAGLEQTVCEWANAQSAVWERWIPVETNCLEGQGLVDETGAFTENRTAAQQCASCPPGRVSSELNDAQGRTYQCQACQPGRFQVSTGLLECELCAPGTAAPSRGMASCARCDFAEYAAVAGAAQCEPCPAGFVTSSKGARSVDACVCPAGTYRDAAERDRCMDCPSGMVCPIGMDALGFRSEHREQYPVLPQLEPGFWSSATDVLSVFRCEDAIRCRGGAPGDACHDTLQGQSCQHCAPGFFWSGERCIKCGNSATTYLVFPVPFLPCLALFVVIVALYRFFGDEYHLWDSWQNGVGAVLFLCLHHYHLLKVIQRTDTPFNEPVVRAMSYFTWSSNPWSLVDFSCSGFSSFLSQMVLQSLGPAFIAAGYAVVWSASQSIGRHYPAVKMEKNRTWSGFCSIVLTFFTGIADMALTVFKCAKNPNGKYSLVADRSIVCYEGEWNGLLAVGIVSALVWCGGTLLVCIYAIWSAPSHFHRADVQARWKFLFIRYRIDVHWWALVIVMKGLIVNLICVIQSVGIGQLTWIFITLLVYLHITCCYRPWRCPLNNFLEIDVHLSLLLVVCASMTWFAFPAEAAAGASGGQGPRGETLVQAPVFALPPACLLFAAMIYARRGSQRARSQKAQDIERLTELVRVMADDDKLGQFLANLSEPDWLVMASAKNIMQHEFMMQFMAVRSRRGYSFNKVLSTGTTFSNTGFRTRLSIHDPEPPSTIEVDAALEDGGQLQRESVVSRADSALKEQQAVEGLQGARTAAFAEPSQPQGHGKARGRVVW